MQPTPEKSSQNKIAVRCRAIIVNEGKLLVVKHSVDSKFYALPGGHLEWGEGVKECMSREIVEELGVKPEIGRLQYIHTFIDEHEGVQSIEFFFEVVNSADYLNIEKNTRSHDFEIAELRWVSREEDVVILPKIVEDDFKAGNLLSDTVKYNLGHWRG